MHAKLLAGAVFVAVLAASVSFSLSTSKSQWRKYFRSVEQSSSDEQRNTSEMRILVLFSSTANDLGIDYRIGRHVLKLAIERARKVRPEVSNIELIVHNELADCKELSALPNFVAERFYLSDKVTAECGGSRQDYALNKSDHLKHIGQSTAEARPEPAQCLSSTTEEQDSHELDEYFGERSSPDGSGEAAQQADTYARSKKIDAIIGPSCDTLVDIIARMAAYWRTPMYTVTSINAKFGRKDIYSTLTRLSPSIDHLSMFLVRVMKQFNWKHLAVLVDRSRIENEILLENLEKTIDNNQHSIPIERTVFGLLQDRVNETRVNQADNSTNLVADTTPTRKETLCKGTMRQTLLEASRVARVFLLLLDETRSVRGLLLCAHELDMNNGEYTFITLNLGLKSTTDATGERRNNNDERESASSNRVDWFVADDEANNAKARQMFESLMVLSVEQPVGDEYNAFVEQTLDAISQSEPGIRCDRSDIGLIAIALHDSLLLAVEAHWRARLSTSTVPLQVDTPEMAQLDSGEAEQYAAAALMWNATYTDGLMTSIYINSNGDQELDYVLSDLEPEMGSMRHVASYSKQTRQVQMLPNSYIHWPARFSKGSRELIDSDEAPPDEPDCGFDGQAERCIDRQNLYAALTVLFVLVVMTIATSIISVARYKRIKYQMKLDDFWWRIQWDELIFVELAGGSASGSMFSGGSIARSAIMSEMRAANRSNDACSTVVSQRRGAKGALEVTNSGSVSKEPKLKGVAKSLAASQFTSRGSHLTYDSKAPTATIRSEYSVIVRQSKIARHKEDLVVVKQLNADTIEINRNLLIELKSMRELCQENLARFVGLCVEPGRLAIVGEYCSRGSLMDLLHNESVTMDLTLKYSILGDIINGLNFIHTSLLNFHGRLKSTNLVLDSRFTVKLTDFGLRSLYCQLNAVENQEDTIGEPEKCPDDVSESKSGKRSSTRRPSMTQTIYHMDSVSMHGESSGQQQNLDPTSFKLKNRGPIRYFWTAPEHLRDKSPHIAGSKRGDIYSLAIIMFELFTRKTPYFYGTNAAPDWGAVKKLAQKSRKLDASASGSRLRASRQSISSAASSQMHLAPGGQRKSHLSGASNFVSRQAERARDRIRRSQVSVGPQIDEQVDADTISVKSFAKQSSSLHASTSRSIRQPSISVSPVASLPICEEPAGQDQSANTTGGMSRESSASGSNAKSGVSHMRHAPSQTKKQSTVISSGSSGVKSKDAESGTGVTAAMAEQILDQLRMGVQPEPVRPYVPNSLLQDVDINLIELMIACWAESPTARPSVERVRAKIKKITAGVASKNYLDNLLERLQTYAAELERIVDEKSSDIIAEKARTEELLYQLVPKFVADKLKHHEPIIPQLFDGVTVFFSDIVGFEKYSAVLSPVELVDLLNNIYSSFESIINSFDVIKIEVILDQFLVASGISLQDGGIKGVGEQPKPIESTKESTNITEALVEDEKDAQKQAKVPKSTRKLLNALRLTQSTDSDKADDIGDNKKQQQVNSSDRSDKIDTKQDAVAVVLSSEHYKRSCAEQIARMALCIRDLVKSFHFRQTLSRASGGSCADNNSHKGARDDDNVPSEAEVASAAKTKTSGESAVAQSLPKVDNIIASTFNIRIGIHSGKVCAGIVGLKRPKFCLIGDTVNVASRMHTNSKANKIQVSADTSYLLQDVPGLLTQPRGKIEVKGKGQMETFWLETSR